MAAAQPAWRCVDADTSNLYVAVQSVGSALQCAGPDRLRCTFYEDNACSTVVSWSQAPAAGYMGGTSCRSNTQGWCLIGSDPKAGQPLPAGWTGGRSCCFSLDPFRSLTEQTLPTFD